MQRKEFQQQLWLDFVHRHPDIGALDIWPDSINPEYLMFLTLNQGPFRSEKLLPSLYHQGYRRVKQYAMADRGLLVDLLLPRMVALPSCWRNCRPTACRRCIATCSSA